MAAETKKEQPPERTLVFVYGTLLKGEPNHDSFLASRGAKFVKSGVTEGYFVMFGRGFPLARPAIATDDGVTVGRVRGEIYSVDKDCLGHLDALEGHPNFYRRTPTKIDGIDNEEMTVEMYHWNQGNDTVIYKSEIWPDHDTKILDWREREQAWYNRVEKKG
jgi:gamma-glutamylcyclotransferase (GGCT)/AIG2-like uncharacterized protein YtfP